MAQVGEKYLYMSPPPPTGMEQSNASHSIMAQSAVSSALLKGTTLLPQPKHLSAPNVRLKGHGVPLSTCKWAPTSTNGVSSSTLPLLASGGMDGRVFLWNLTTTTTTFTTTPTTANTSAHIATLSDGKPIPVLDLDWSRDSSKIYTAYSNGTAAMFNVETGENERRFRGHEGPVNSISVSKRGTELIATGGDDGTIRLWDPRSKYYIASFHGPVPANPSLPVTAITFSQDASTLFSAGLDNAITAWDLRSGGDKATPSYSLMGHTNTITGLSVGPDGDYLLSYGMDNMLHLWDIQPFAVAGVRLLKTFVGAAQGMERNLLRPCWSPTGLYVCAPSADRSIFVWEVASGEIIYQLPGHQGCVTCVDWTSTVIASASMDQSLIVGEIDVEVLQ